LGGRTGIDLRILHELAGHSTPTLTARYSHRRLYDLAGAVEKMPCILPTQTASNAPTRTAPIFVSRRMTRRSPLGNSVVLAARVPHRIVPASEAR
jgi:hypothetical protein